MPFGCFCTLAIANNVTVTMEVHISFLITLLSLDKYPEVKMLDHMVILFLLFWGISILSFIEATATYISTNSTWGFSSLSVTSSALVICCLFDDSLIRGVRSYVTVALVCTSLVISDTEHLFTCCWPSLCLLWKNIYPDSLPVFQSSCFIFVFWCWAVWIFCIF